MGIWTGICTTPIDRQCWRRTIKTEDNNDRYKRWFSTSDGILDNYLAAINDSQTDKFASLYGVVLCSIVCCEASQKCNLCFFKFVEIITYYHELEKIVQSFH